LDFLFPPSKLLSLGLLLSRLIRIQGDDQAVSVTVEVGSGEIVRAKHRRDAHDEIV